MSASDNMNSLFVTSLDILCHMSYTTLNRGSMPLTESLSTLLISITGHLKDLCSCLSTVFLVYLHVKLIAGQFSVVWMSLLSSKSPFILSMYP